LLIGDFIAASDYILTPIATVYSKNALAISVVLLLIGAFIQLAGKLDAAILSARHDNYFVQSVMTISPVLTYSAAIIGTLLKRPIEGLAIGTVLTGIATVSVYRFRLFHHHSEWIDSKNTLSSGDSVKRFFSLTRRGWHLYSCSVGMMIRGPIYRLVIVSVVGLQAAAVFDIAMRLTQAVRGVIATGFSVLFPSFAFLSRSGERVKTIELIQISLMVLLTLGSLSLGLLMGAIRPILSVWLGDYPPDLVPSTRILAIWHIITLANVPFWYLLQATHNESVAALSIWAHTFAIILVIPFSSVFNISVVDLMVYWTVTSVLTQGLIYYYVQKKLGLLWQTVLNPRIIILLLVVITYSSSSYWISSRVTDMQEMALYFSPTTATLVVITALVVWKPLHRFLSAPGNSMASW
jgi:O-antigen/teichoic acid export membrane protein